QTRTLLSYQYPVKLRKGIVRDGTFKYITSGKKNSCTFRKEIFFKPKSVRDNCFEDYLLETLKYLVNQGEPTLIFFATCTKTRQWAKWLAARLKSPTPASTASPSSPSPSSSAPKDLAKMEETLSRDELLKPLEKGIAFYNQDLSWEERHLIETYLKKGEIKIICATTTLAMDLNLPFKNVIIPLDKMHDDNNDEDYLHNYRTSINFADIENMGGRAGILNIGNHQNSTPKKQKFGRVIFLAHSRLSETVFKNLYFKFLKNNNPDNNNDNTSTGHLLKKEKDLPTYLLRLLLKYNFKPKKLKKYFKKNTPSGYWRFIFPQGNIDEEINNCLHILKENNLTEEDSNGNLSLTPNGILIAAKRIKVETFLFLKTWMNYSKKGEISNLEILYILSQTPDGKELPIPFYHPSINDYKKDKYKCDREEIHAERILQLIFQQNEQDKKLYQKKILLKNCKEDEVFSLPEHLSFKKTLLLYDWVTGVKNVKTIEQEYNLYQGAIYRLGEGFSWLADSLAVIAENSNWKKKRKEDLDRIKLLSNRLILSSFPSKNYKPKTKNFSPTSCNLPPTSCVSPPPRRDKTNVGVLLNTNNQRLTTILEIDIHRPDRIIFMGKNIEVTAKEFSLIHLLAQHNGQVMSYEDIIKKLWGAETEAIYTRIIQHIYKFRKNILDAIGHNKINREKVRDIFKVVPGRGVMLNINDTEIKIN
ncbi:MAG: hypothetical protein FP833_03455, partial [Atribacteria sp.]|nr:hypothetical protein [Candidatus Atribacteria bacterium]